MKVLILAAAAVAHFSESLGVDAVATPHWRQRVLYPGKPTEHTQIHIAIPPDTPNTRQARLRVRMVLILR